MTAKRTRLHGKGWSDDEIRAAFDAYMKMLRQQSTGVSFRKADIINELVNDTLSGRSRKAVEFRMCNISSVLFERSMPIVDGFKPLAHVGARHRDSITKLIDST